MLPYIHHCKVLYIIYINYYIINIYKCHVRNLHPPVNIRISSMPSDPRLGADRILRCGQVAVVPDDLRQRAAIAVLHQDEEEPEPLTAY